MNSGIYIRVDRKNVLLEDMTPEQRAEWLAGLNTEGLVRTIDILCNTLTDLKETYNITEEEDDE